MASGVPAVARCWFLNIMSENSSLKRPHTGRQLELTVNSTDCVLPNILQQCLRLESVISKRSKKQLITSHCTHMQGIACIVKRPPQPPELLCLALPSVFLRPQATVMGSLFDALHISREPLSRSTMCKKSCWQIVKPARNCGLQQGFSCLVLPV